MAWLFWYSPARAIVPPRLVLNINLVVFLSTVAKRGKTAHRLRNIPQQQNSRFGSA